MSDEDGSLEGTPLAVLATIGWYFGYGIATGLPMALVAQLMGEVQAVPVGLAQLIGGLLAIIALLAFHAPEQSGNTSLAWRRTGVGLLLVALPLGLALQGPSESLWNLNELIQPSSAEELQQRLEFLDTSSWPKAVGLLVVLGIAVPVVEELFFRGALFGLLARLAGPRFALFATAVSFAMIHGHPLWVIVPALLLGYLRLASGSIGPGLVAHLTFNLVSLLPLVLGVPDFPLPWQAQAVGWAMLIGGVVLFHKLALWSAQATDARDLDLSNAPPDAED